MELSERPSPKRCDSLIKGSFSSFAASYISLTAFLAAAFLSIDFSVSSRTIFAGSKTSDRSESAAQYPFSLITRAQKESNVCMYEFGSRSFWRLSFDISSGLPLFSAIAWLIASSAFSRMCSAAAIVNVTTRMLSNECFLSSGIISSLRSSIILVMILWIMTVVFPEPAAAGTRIFSVLLSIIACWSIDGDCLAIVFTSVVLLIFKCFLHH